jgi:hypothetical protein
MAGNHPDLPDDTVSRQIRIVLMPDLDGTVEDSDWELIEGEAKALAEKIAKFADSVRDDIALIPVDLPAGCVGRHKEKWRPLARVAAAVGGDWPAIAEHLISADLAAEQAAREDGLQAQPADLVALQDLCEYWPKGMDGKHREFVPTIELVSVLISNHREYWGARLGHGELNATRLGRLVNKATKTTSIRPHTQGPRGYARETLLPVWRRLGLLKNPDKADNPADSDNGLAQ